MSPLRLFSLIAIVVLGAVATPLYASEELRLGQAFDLALQHDNAWAAARQRYLATREAYPIARSGLLPSLSAGASYARVDRETAQVGRSADRNYSQDNVRVQLRQPIVNLERVIGLRMAQRDVTVGEFELELARQDLIRRVVAAYFNLLLAQEQVALSASQIEAIKAQRLQAEKLREGGIATLTDVHEAQARLDRARADEIAAINALEVSRRELIKITGRPAMSVAPLDEATEFLPPEPNDLDAWVFEAIENALEVQARTTLAERAALNLERTRSQHLPTLDAYAAYERSSNTDIGLATDKIGRVGVELNIPLYLGGRINAQSRQAVAQRDQADEELLLARRQAELEASTAFSELNNSLARIRALEEAVRSGEVALQAAEISFSVAYRTFVDVLNAQQLLYTSRFDVLRARFDYVQALVRLKAAVGALDESIIERIDLWLHKD